MKMFQKKKYNLCLCCLSFVQISDKISPHPLYEVLQHRRPLCDDVPDVLREEFVQVLRRVGHVGRLAVKALLAEPEALVQVLVGDLRQRKAQC